MNFVENLLAHFAKAGPRRLSEKSIARQREQTAAWRWYTPRPLILPKHGPRPARTYRAARRNARFGRT